MIRDKVYSHYTNSAYYSVDASHRPCFLIEIPRDPTDSYSPEWDIYMSVDNVIDKLTSHIISEMDND